jgi:hypothetical protein
VVNITLNSPERSYIEYTGMPSAICQYVINLVVSLPIRRGPGVFMYVLWWEHCVLNNQIF